VIFFGCVLLWVNLCACVRCLYFLLGLYLCDYVNVSMFVCVCVCAFVNECFLCVRLCGVCLFSCLGFCAFCWCKCGFVCVCVGYVSVCVLYFLCG